MPTDQADDLRHWREEHRLTQAQLASLLDLTRNTITRWETGVSEFPVRMVDLALCELDRRLRLPAKPK